MMTSPIPVSDRIRLHISPFTPALLHSYIPPSLLPEATNISYHTLQTFPERNYGYIELPKMSAQKIKAKLNGSTLKGSKIKIEEARPEKRKAKADDEDEVIEEERPRKKKSKKAKKEDGEIEGVVLPEGRKVKRGWTETVAEKSKDRREKKDRKGKKEEKNKKEKKKKEVSKYTTEPECLFRTELPANVTLAANDGKKAKKHKSKKEVVVHEFSNTIKHASFLKSGTIDKSSKVAVEFIEGKGWVDEDGNLVEEESEFQRAKRRRLEAMETRKAGAKTKAKVEAEAKSKKSKKPPTPEPESSSDDISSSDPSSDSDSGSDSESATDDASSSTSSTSVASPRPQPADLEIKTPAKEVHPLEALFKRAPPNTTAETSPTTKPPPITTAFNFFAEEEQEAEASQIPKTPGTRKDLEWRSVRSPAPTPDTAAVNRKFSFSAVLGRTDEEDVEEDEDLAMYDMPPVREEAAGMGTRDDGDGQEESEFSKWFWENRGDNNRAWKKRRREAMKVRRKRENRRLTRRVV
ncbi:hypothetical protein FKW77_006211 [Venturia effusa]|uniref:RRM domain-containing protein n=1 Tax=Venturia effusa TaxID=50376 RepID=A0A517LJ48_9PEZI|nr:hypothetical protein FKW77_006211 [Venturia effusa]